MNLHFPALFALLLSSGCATNNLPNLSKPLPEVPSCPVASFMACEAPVTSSDKTLAATEAADVENRARWLRCAERHNTWLQCAAVLVDRGFLQSPGKGK